MQNTARRSLCLLHQGTNRLRLARGCPYPLPAVTAIHCEYARWQKLTPPIALFPLRNFHASGSPFAKEPSKVEETVKNLREQEEQLPPSAQVAKRSLGKRVWDELVHYYHGFRLLFIDVRVSCRLVLKLLKGNTLSRREHKQLVRTVSDLFRLVPFLVILIVPFMELLLPVFLKFFPSMLPSTFQTLPESELKFKKQLKVKIEIAKFLQNTLDQMAVISKGETHSKTAKEFAEFFERIRTTGDQASNEEILKYSKLFEDEITLDSLSRPQLIALCRLLELQPFGTNNFLRFQLRNRLRSLRADDQLIMKEGIDSLDVSEVQAACRARGMRALGIPEERLKSQLQQWLELSLNAKIPNSLLLLSRALYLPDNLSTTDQLKVTLSALPQTAATETKYKIGEMEGKVHNKTKLELIKREEEEIKKEAQELEQQLLDEQQKDDVKIPEEQVIDQIQKEILIDKATILEDKAEELEKVPSESKKEEFSNEDFQEIENALENVVSEKSKLLIEKEEIEDLKEDMAEYKQDIEELKDAIQETGNEDIVESKAALILSNKVNKMISEMDKLVVEVNKAKEDLQQETATEQRHDIVGIHELVVAIRKMQKVSDDTRLQRIVDVLEKMDVDRDGSVEVEHVLKVTELLRQDNVKVTPKQMDDIIELLTKEECLVDKNLTSEKEGDKVRKKIEQP